VARALADPTCQQKPADELPVFADAGLVLLIVLLYNPDKQSSTKSSVRWRLDEVRAELHKRGFPTHTPECSKQIKEWYQIANTREKTIKQLAKEFEQYYQRWLR
jgi:hypothetical protein